MKRNLIIAIISSIAVIAVSLLLFIFTPGGSSNILLSPEDFNSCTPPTSYSSTITITGSEEYTTNSNCISSPDYPKALQAAERQAKENAISLCKNSPPKIDCPESCSPKYTDLNCEILFPIRTEISSTGTSCEVIAFVTIEASGNAGCFNLENSQPVNEILG